MHKAEHNSEPKYSFQCTPFITQRFTTTLTYILHWEPLQTRPHSSSKTLTHAFVLQYLITLRISIKSQHKTLVSTSCKCFAQQIINKNRNIPYFHLFTPFRFHKSFDLNYIRVTVRETESLAISRYECPFNRYPVSTISDFLS